MELNSVMYLYRKRRGLSHCRESTYLIARGQKPITVGFRYLSIIVFNEPTVVHRWSRWLPA